MSNELQAAFLAWLFAVPFWLLFWAVWSGRLRWLNDNLFGPYATTLLPGTAAGVTIAGLGFALELEWLAATSLVFFVAGFVLSFVVAIWDPVWMQPAWFREELASGPDARGRGGEFVAAVARSAEAPEGFGPVRFERDAVLFTDDPDRPVAVTVRYGRLGRLFVFDGAVVFVQNESAGGVRSGGDRAGRVACGARDGAERNLANIRRLVRGDLRGRRFGRVLEVEVDEGWWSSICVGWTRPSPRSKRPPRPLRRDGPRCAVVPAVRAGRHGRVFLLDRHVAFVQAEVERRVRDELEPVAFELRVDDPDGLLATIKARAALRRASVEAADPVAGGAGEGTRRRRPRPD